MKENCFKRITSGILAGILVLGYIPSTAFAAEDGLCEHHTQHTEACGYSAAVEGHECGHEHTAECYQSVTECVHSHGDCGYVPAVEGHGCDCQPNENSEIVHTEGCGYEEAVAEVPCGHVCSEENGCITKVLNCQHQHDDSCGYVEEKAESFCTFLCEECVKKRNLLLTEAETNNTDLTYHITFDTNGGTIKGSCPESYTSGEAVALPTDVRREGFRFLGWFIGDQCYSNISTDETGDKSFTAKWEEKVSISIDTTTQIYSYDGSEKSFLLKTTDGSSLSIQSGNWVVPCAFTSILTPFGTCISPTTGMTSFHQGVDLDTEAGWSVVAAKAGTVSKVGYSPADGNYVKIDHGDRIVSTYMHLNNYCVMVGQIVNTGELIGTTGATGVTSGNHLHFEIQDDDVYVDPCNYVSFYGDEFSVTYSPASGLNSNGLPVDAGSYDVHIVKGETADVKAVNLTIPSALIVKEKVISNNFTWSIEDGILTISGASPMPDYSIGNAPWYGRREEITACVIQEGVPRIGSYAFCWMDNLSEVIVPDSVTSIGDGAFLYSENCKITFSGTMKQWSDIDTPCKPGAYCEDGSIIACGVMNDGRWYLTDNYVLYIQGGYCGFTTWELADMADQITEVVFCEGTEGFLDGTGTLANASNVTSITFPNSFVHLDSVISTNSLTEIHISDLAAWCQMERMQYLLGNCMVPSTKVGLYLNGQIVTDMVIPEGVEKIVDKAFAGYGRLESITFPSSLNNIGNEAFYFCYNLAQVRFEGAGITISDDAFTTVNATVYYPVGHWYNSQLKNYGGHLTWVEYGNDAKRLYIDEFYSCINVGESEKIEVSVQPFDATADCEYTISEGGIVEILSSDRKSITLKGLKPGKVTLTVRDKLTGLVASRVLSVINYKSIPCPYEESIPIDSSYQINEYLFIPSETAYYALTIPNLGEYSDSCGLSVTYGTKYVEDVSSQWGDETLCSVYFFEKGKTYTIKVRYYFGILGEIASFRLTKARSEVTSISIEHPSDTFDCEVGDYYNFRVSIVPFDAYGDTSWTSSNPEIVSIEQQTGNACGISANQAGVATISALCGGKRASLTIQVHDEIVLELGGTKRVEFVNGYSNRTLRYTADEDGRYAITARGDNCANFGYSGRTSYNPSFNYQNGGKTMIVSMNSGDTVKLYCYGGSDGEEQCTFTVSKALDSPSKMELVCLGEYRNGMHIGACFFPDTTAEKIVKWEIDNADILTQEYVPWESENKTFFEKIGNGEVTVTATSENGLTASYTVEVHSCSGDHVYQKKNVEASCTKGGYVSYTCTICNEGYIESRTAALDHNYSDWILTTIPTSGTLGTETRTCIRCEYFETREVPYTGNILDLRNSGLETASTVWINGVAYPVQKDDAGAPYVEIPDNAPPVLVTYSYNNSSDDRHTQYPTGMQAYRIHQTPTGSTVERLPALDNLLQYSGSSIRITGNKGIRMITSVNQDTRNALTGNGLAGFKLLEYGTLLAQTSKLGDNPLVLGGGEYVKSNYAYKKGVADPVFKYTNGLIQYTNVLIGFTDEQCKEDIAMRPYMKLQDENGEEFVIYGGIVYRSIGYIAYQNRNAFQPRSAAYEYVWSIIHNVYGNQYDSEYKK